MMVKVSAQRLRAPHTHGFIGLTNQRGTQLNTFDDKHAPEYGEATHDTGSWEMEDRARHLRESGYPGGWRGVFAAAAGHGENSRISQSIFGENKAKFECIAEREPNPRVFKKPRDPEFDEPGRCLTASQVKDLYSAVAYANSIGLVMNVHISITWGMLGIEDHTAAANVLCYEFIKHLRDWYRNHVPKDRPFVWLYVHEVGRTHGFHTHILTAIPVELRPAFREWVRARLAGAAHLGVPPHKDASKVVAPPSDPIGRQWWYLQYLAKGVRAEAEVRSVVGVDPYVRVSELIKHPLKSPGDVRCQKNCGVSNTIGKERRRKAGFRSLLERGIADVRRLYAGMEYLEYLRQQEADVTDTVARRLIEVERQVDEFAQWERDNARLNAKARKAQRAARRREKAEQERTDKWIVAFRREQAEISQRLMKLFTV
ncbi:hypothetical protein [Burkholderia ubonensis]|uniref:hypothetical protein n=1 Tax=Burkholderia ubonensis TaxID=101571 RepID=UPI0012F811D2|nr:hypothetical protein [Burkholderia ubonensis]